MTSLRADPIDVALSGLAPQNGEGYQGGAADHSVVRPVACLFGRVKRALRCDRYSERVAQMARLAVDSGELQRLLQEVPQAAVDAMRVEHAVIHLLSADGSEFRIAAGVGLSPSEGLDVRVACRSDALPGVVVAQGRAVIATDDQQAALGGDTPAGREARSSGPRSRSVLAVPLFDCGRVVGVFTVRAGSTRDFRSEDVRFLETLSSLLAAGLQRECGDKAHRMGQLTGEMARDFDSLLTAISDKLQPLDELPATTGGDADFRQMVAAAARAVRRGTELTGKLLAFSRRLVLHPMPVDVGALLHPFADLLGRAVDQRIRVMVDVEPHCPPCLVDPAQLESALLNLAVNARDAMLDGGTLSLNAWPVDHIPTQAGAQRTAESRTGYVAIAVGDTGAGMSDAVKQRALEPFFTTKETGRGAGLGLSAVSGFMDQSRGAMLLDSTLGVGTTITLFLPQQRAK